MRRVCWLLSALLVVSIESCARHKRIEIKNISNYDSLLTIVKANGREVFKEKVGIQHNKSSSQFTTFKYGGESCRIQVDIPELNLEEIKDFVDLDHKYISITVMQQSALATQISIDAPNLVQLVGAAE
jgi:hypothetical protein